MVNVMYGTMKLSAVEREALFETISKRLEPIYQGEAYLNLVTTPYNRIVNDPAIRGDLLDERAIAIINERLRDHVKAWAEEKKNRGIVIPIEKLIWTVRLNRTRDGIETDHFPTFLLELEEGVADIVLFRPSHETAIGLIEEEAKKNLELKKRTETTIFIEHRHKDEWVWLTNDEERANEVSRLHCHRKFYAQHEITLPEGRFTVIVISQLIDIHDPKACLRLVREVHSQTTEMLSLNR